MSAQKNVFFEYTQHMIWLRIKKKYYTHKQMHLNLSGGLSTVVNVKFEEKSYGDLQESLCEALTLICIIK